MLCKTTLNNKHIAIPCVLFNLACHLCWKYAALKPAPCYSTVAAHKFQE